MPDERIRAASSRSSESGWSHEGVFQTRYTRAWGTRSAMACRCSPVRLAIQASCRVSGGPDGMLPKYFSTRAFTSAALTSPATTRTAFAAPYHPLNQSFTSSSEAASRSSIAPMVVQE